MVKTNPERVQTQMYVALQIAAALRILCEPFLPFTACKLSGILNNVIPTKEESHLSWKDVTETSDLIPAGHQIGEAEILFAQIEDTEIQKQIDKLEATKKANVMEIASSLAMTEAQKETATFEDFSKLDLRVGTILEAEKMSKANKLLVLKVDTGMDVRTIVSGIAEHFSPEEVIGKRVTVLVNLAPRALRGVESQGMILMTNNAEGKLVFVNPDADGVANGALIS
jgi:methionyl-tRNA synthetase